MVVEDVFSAMSYDTRKKGCFARQRNNKERVRSSNSNDNQEAANYEDVYDSGEVLLLSNKETCRDWILDLGCTYHMTHNENYWLSNFRKIDGGKVMLSHSHTCQVGGIGTTSIKMFDVIIRHFKDVRYNPNLMRNLVSLGVLDDAGYSDKIEVGTMKVYKVPR